MANLTPVSSFDNVIQHETNTLLLAGPGQPMNQQAQSLLNRTEFLKDFDESLSSADAPSDGAAVIARASQVVDSVSDLRDLLGASASKYALTTGYYGPGDGGGGMFYADLSDTTSADNGGTVIVGLDGTRWKMLFDSSISVKQFGAVGDYDPATGFGTDDSGKMNAALTFAAMVNFGAVKRTLSVEIPTNGANFLVDSADLNIPQSVSLFTRRSNIDYYRGANFSIESGSIWLNTSRTIRMGASTSLRGVTVLPKAMTFPQSAAQLPTWAGTGVTIEGQATQIVDTAIVGFNRCIDWLSAVAPAGGRHRWQRLLLDGTNGVRHGPNLDTCYFSDIHGWPVASYIPGGAPNEALIRDGIFWEFFAASDYQYFTNCFSFGWQDAAWIWNARCSAFFTSCDVDGVPSPGSMGEPKAALGFVMNVASGARFVNCSAAQQAKGAVINHANAGNASTTFLGGSMFSCVTGIEIVEGGADIKDIKFNGGSEGIVVGAAAGADHIHIDGNEFFNQSTRAITITGLGSKNDTYIGPTNTFLGTTPAITNAIGTLAVTAASTLPVPKNQSTFRVAGASTTINLLDAAAQYGGRQITLHFETAQTLTHSANLVLKGGVNATPAAGNIMTFYASAANVWREVSRNF